ncbi:MAG: peptidylprolyl isomerase [bacterium]|jgi:peptidylprolyl isomerase
MSVQRGDRVKIHYTGSLENGYVFDSSEGNTPLEFQVGSGMVIVGFDAGVLGMKMGDIKTITIPPEEAYGEHREELLLQVPVNNFPPELELKEGLVIGAKTEGGGSRQFTVIAISDEYVSLDGNHSLVGKTLIFDLELVEVLQL